MNNFIAKKDLKEQNEFFIAEMNYFYSINELFVIKLTFFIAKLNQLHIKKNHFIAKTNYSLLNFLGVKINKKVFIPVQKYKRD